MSRLNILSIDDNSEFNIIFKREIAKIAPEYIVTTTETSANFFKLLDELKPSLCFTDINLSEGDLNGFSIIHRIKHEMGLSIPVIVLSRAADKENVSKAIELGASDFINKPIDPYILEVKLGRALRSYRVKQRYGKIPEMYSKCQITENFEISEISEFGISILSPLFMSKQTLLKTNCEFLEKVTSKKGPFLFNVSACTPDEKDNFKIFLEFDSNDGELLFNVKSWLNTQNAQ